MMHVCRTRLWAVLVG